MDNFSYSMVVLYVIIYNKILFFVFDNYVVSLVQAPCFTSKSNFLLKLNKYSFFVYMKSLCLQF